MKSIYSIFLKGLLAVLPLAITIYLFVWLMRGLESIFQAALRWLLPTGWYHPGMGVILGLGLIFLVGLLLKAWFVRKLWGWSEYLVEKIPLVNEIYGALKQVVQYVSGKQQSDNMIVVMVTIGDASTRFLGVVTRHDLSDAPHGINHDDTVAVFLPWSYQVGGFTVYVPKSKIQPVDMKTKDALRWALTAGLSK